MYEWYRNSEICYAYLEGLTIDDVQDAHSKNDYDVWEEKARSGKSKFAQHRWFQRGWTLQELISPSKVEFYGENWVSFGSITSLLRKIVFITGVDEKILSSHGERKIILLRRSTVAQRMSWAARRTTTRIEDQAYCLLGIFGVNMPLLYGEGAAAFIRLQEEIMKISSDHSILAWPSKIDLDNMLLAPSPSYFKDCGSIIPWQGAQFSEPFSMTNAGLSISLPIVDVEGQTLAILSCGHKDETMGPIALRLGFDFRYMSKERPSYWITSHTPGINLSMTSRKDRGGRVKIIKLKDAEKAFASETRNIVILREPDRSSLNETFERIRANSTVLISIHEHFQFSDPKVNRDWKLQFSIEALYPRRLWRKSPLTELHILDLPREGGVGSIHIFYRDASFVINFGLEKQDWYKEAPDMWINIHSTDHDPNFERFIELDKMEVSNTSIISEASVNTRVFAERDQPLHETYGFAVKKWGKKRTLIPDRFPDNLLTVEIVAIRTMGEVRFEIFGKAEKLTLLNPRILAMSLSDRLHILQQSFLNTDSWMNSYLE
jgi:hypothetical protein